MTTPNTQAVEAAEREKFEAWAKTQGTPEQGWWLRQLPDGGYSSHAADVSWNAWKARAELTRPQEVAVGDVVSDLRARCAEIIQWQDTGILKGQALRSLAEQINDEAYGLQRAESKTAREAMEIVASRAPVVRAEPVYLVATGVHHEGEETYTRHSVCPPMCDAEKLYTAPPSTAPVADWEKLRDPDTLHANLLRGLPAQLTKGHLRHLLGEDAAQPKDPAPVPVKVKVGEAPDRHIHENAARLLIDYFLCEKLDVKDAPSVTLEKQGEGESESHSWAFWVLSDDTTSYLHEDGRIEWYGTAWEPEIDGYSTPATDQGKADWDAAVTRLSDGWALEKSLVTALFYTLLPHWQRDPLQKRDVHLLDEQGDAKDASRAAYREGFCDGFHSVDPVGEADDVDEARSWGRSNTRASASANSKGAA